MIDVIAVTGPTACGKTRLAVELAKSFNGEIVSVDSRQIYRGMDIGTGKDLNEYENIPYHLIDVTAPGERYTLSDFLRDAATAVREIDKRGHRVILCGGSAMWLHAFLNGYTLPGGESNPQRQDALRALGLEKLTELFKNAHHETALHFKDWDNLNRLARAVEIAEGAASGQAFSASMPEMRSLMLAPYYPRTVVRERIARRLESRLAEGMIDEGRTLLSSGMTFEEMDWMGLEYRYLGAFLQNKMSLEQMTRELFQKICQFAKRQDIWFRRFERDGLDIYWLREGNLPEAQKLCETFLSARPLPAPELRLSETFYGPQSH